MATARRPAAAPARPASRPAKKTPGSMGQRRAERSGTASKPPVPTARGRIKVRATQMGYYGLKRRREGDVFVITDPKHFSKRWMEVVEGALPLKETGAQEALDRKHDEILGGKAQRPAVDDDDDRDDEDDDDVVVE